MSGPLWSKHPFQGSVEYKYLGRYMGWGYVAAGGSLRTMKRADRPARADGPGVAPPSAEALQVAKFAIAIGVKLLGIHRDVALRWFRPSESESERGVQGKAIKGAIYVRQAEHAPEFLTEVVVHELVHVGRDAVVNNAAREAHALAYGRKWAPAVYAAGRVTDFDATRITLIAERHPRDAHPTLKARRGDVVLSRSNARAWEWRDGWRELLT